MGLGTTHMSPEASGAARPPAHLRPRARIMRTLGDELISSEVVAVIELVKNAYDADATRVLIRFHEPLEPGQGGIDVIDDGHGMSIDTVEQAWLEPATPYRRRSQRSEGLSRHVLGEKGIGRFAVSRLANELELVTRRPSAPVETTVLFDWSVFDNDEAYLDEIEFVLDEAPASQIAPGGAIEALWPDAEPPSPDRLERGTLLRMTSLRTSWTDKAIADLKKGLSRLVSPFLFEQYRDQPDAFSIRLDAPTFPALSGVVEPPEILRNPHYFMRANVDERGHCSSTIRLRNASDEITREGTLRDVAKPPTSGAFTVELRAWDRDAASMAELAGTADLTSAEARRVLNDVAGVSVYRDGFRVLPYGQEGDDWLSLDRRRVNNPTMRLSNNQVVGYVLISRESNPDLRDQTNREGLIDNEAFADFKQQLTAVITELETARYAVRPREEPPRPRAGGLFAGLDLASVRAYANERYPGDNQLAGLLGEAQENLDEGLERAQEVVARYRRLATLGELIDNVLHEGRAPLGKMGNDAKIALRDIARAEMPCEDLVAAVRGRIERIAKQHDVLAAVFHRIEPFSGRRRGRPSPRTLETIVADSVAVLEGDLKQIDARVDLPQSSTTVTADETELQQVFVNLLRNSIYWLREVPRDDRRIRISVLRDDDGLHVLFSDSGPGVREDVRDRIFDPYFSTAENGVGLGLSISGEIVEEYYDGDLALLDSGPLPGATFRVTLRRRV
jgi:signal transduction histidine kinase